MTGALLALAEIFAFARECAATSGRGDELTVRRTAKSVRRAKAANASDAARSAR